MIKKIVYKVVPSRILKAIELWVHSGNNFTCSFCGYNAKDLSAIGIDIEVLKQKEVVGAGRRNAGCYKCGSTDRERLIYLYLKNVIKIFESDNLKILHLAPEKNLSNVLKNCTSHEYVCGDLFTEGYNYPEYVRNMNVLNIPFEENYFDLVICNHLLEHVPDDATAMRELFRVLKPNGKAILQVPISRNSENTYEDFSITIPKERELAFGQFDHVRIYGKDYIQRLNAAGFQVDRKNISTEYPKEGLCLQEDIFIGLK